MADNETSKITWIAITVALAGTIYGITSNKLPELTNQVMSKIAKVVGVDTEPTQTDPDTEDNSDTKIDGKTIKTTLNYASNGQLVIDTEGNGYLRAIDKNTPIVVADTAARDNAQLFSNVTKTLDIRDTVVVTKSANDMFKGFPGTAITNLRRVDLSSVNSATGMFSYAPNMTELYIEKLNMSNSVSIDGMFEGMSSLKHIDVSGLNTSGVYMMSNLFRDDTKLETIDGLDKFDTKDVKFYNYMFNNTPSLKTLDLSSFDFSHIKSGDLSSTDDEPYRNMFVGINPDIIININGTVPFSKDLFTEDDAPALDVASLMDATLGKGASKHQSKPLWDAIRKGLFTDIEGLYE